MAAKQTFRRRKKVTARASAHIELVLNANLTELMERRRKEKAENPDAKPPIHTCNVGGFTSYLIIIANRAGVEEGVSDSVCFQEQDVLAYESGVQPSTQTVMNAILKDECLAKIDERNHEFDAEHKTNKIYIYWDAFALLDPEHAEYSIARTQRSLDRRNSATARSPKLGEDRGQDSAKTGAETRRSEDRGACASENLQVDLHSNPRGGGDFLIPTTEEIPEDDAHRWLRVQWDKAIANWTPAQWDALFPRWVQLWDRRQWADAICKIHPDTPHRRDAKDHAAVMAALAETDAPTLLWRVRCYRCGIDERSSKATALRNWIGADGHRSEPYTPTRDQEWKGRQAKQATADRKHEDQQQEIREREAEEAARAHEAARRKAVGEYFKRQTPAVKKRLTAEAYALWESETHLPDSLREAEPSTLGTNLSAYVDRVLLSEDLDVMPDVIGRVSA